MAELRCIEARMGAAKPLLQYIVAGADCWVWIDSGIASTPDDWFLPELERGALVPPRSNLLVVTHADVDHFGGANRLRELLPGLVVVAHRSDAELLADPDALLARRYDAHRGEGVDLPPSRVAELRSRGGGAVRVDVAVGGDTELRLDEGEAWRLLHAPGHSDGHLVVWNPDRRVVIAGDAVMGWGVVDAAGELQPPHYTDVAAYLGSIAMVRALDPVRLCLSHRTELRDGAVRDFLDESEAAVRAIGAAVATAAAELESDAASRLGRICDTVRGSEPRWRAASPAAFASAVAAHLAAGAKG